MQRRRDHKTLKLVELAILTALVAVLQLTGTAIRLGPATSISLVLIPIVLGAILLGPAAGAWLGFEFGVIVYLAGVTGMDFFTFVLFNDHPVLTGLICIAKGVAAGLGAGLIHRWLKDEAPLLSVFLAAGAAPILNTGLFILGALFVKDTLVSNFVAEGSTVMYFLIIGCAGWNFLFEFAVNMILAPALYRIYTAVQKQLGFGHQEG